MNIYIRFLLALLIAFTFSENIISQNIIKPKYSEAYEVDKIISMKGDHVVFKRAGTEFDILKKELEYVIHNELGLIYGSINKTSVAPKSTYDIDTLDINNYSGFLLKEGNKVYIPLNSSKEYEKAGAASLKEIVMSDSFWIVVNSKYEAHFILEYIVDTDGRDNAYYKIMSRNGNQEFSSKKDWFNISGTYGSGTISTNENPDKNIEVAQKLHKRNIEPLYEIIKRSAKKNKYPRYLKGFYLNNNEK